MRYLIVLAALVGALAASTAASAGGWATVELAALPAGIDEGGTWNAHLTVLRHGETPTDGAAPTVTVTGPSGDTTTFEAVPAGETGVYEAEVVFAEAGESTFEISDGLAATGYGESTTTTYPPVLVEAGPGGGGDGVSVPALPFAALLLVLAGAAATIVVLRRSRRLSPAGR
jgi:hypothetical protein